MARFAPNAMIDAALNYVGDGTTVASVCEGQPTTITTGTMSGGTFVAELAEYTGLTSANFTGPVDGDVSGRKITFQAQTGATVNTTGTADHLVLHDNNNTIFYVTTITAQAITAGGTVDTSAFDIEIEDPTAP